MDQNPADTFGELKADGVASAIRDADNERIPERRFEPKDRNLSKVEGRKHIVRFRPTNCSQ